METLILNTSSSIYFAKTGLINLLKKRFSLITTEQIFNEVQAGQEIGYGDAMILRSYFDDKTIRISKTSHIEQVIDEYRIKETDASIISLASEDKGILCTEDRQIEKICLAKQFRIANTAVLIYLLWQFRDLKTDRAFLLLDLLIRNGYNREIVLTIKEKIIQGETHG